MVDTHVKNAFYLETLKIIKIRLKHLILLFRSQIPKILISNNILLAKIMVYGWQSVNFTKYNT